MFDFLSAYLESTVTPEQRRVILDGCYALVEVGISDHEFLIDQELEKTDQLDSDTVISNVSAMLTPMIKQIIAEFGVQLEAEVNLQQATDVLRSLQLVDNYVDQESVYSLTDSPDGPEAALADILQLMGQYQSAEYLTFFARVSPALLDRIQEVCSKENEPLLPSNVIRDRSKMDLQLLITLPNVAPVAPEMLVRYALSEGAHFGLPLEMLIAPYRAQMESLDASRLAIELMGFLCASGTDINDFRKSSSQQLEIIHADISKITAVDVVVTSLIDKLRAAYAGLQKAPANA